MKTWEKVAIGGAVAVGAFLLFRRFAGASGNAPNGTVGIANYNVMNGTCFESRKQPDGSFQSRPVDMHFCCDDVPDLPECGGPITQPADLP